MPVTVNTSTPLSGQASIADLSMSADAIAKKKKAKINPFVGTAYPSLQSGGQLPVGVVGVQGQPISLSNKSIDDLYGRVTGPHDFATDAYSESLKNPLVAQQVSRAISSGRMAGEEAAAGSIRSSGMGAGSSGAAARRALGILTGSAQGAALGQDIQSADVGRRFGEKEHGLDVLSDTLRTNQQIRGSQDTASAQLRGEERAREAQRRRDEAVLQWEKDRFKKEFGADQYWKKKGWGRSGQQFDADMARRLAVLQMLGLDVSGLGSNQARQSGTSGPHANEYISGEPQAGSWVDIMKGYGG